MTDQEGKQDLPSALRQIGEYLISAAGRTDTIDDELVSLAIPLPADTEFRFAIDDLPRLARLAKREYTQRARRLRYFRGDLFGEPAWDILLDLFIAKVSGLRLSITSVCIASQVPSTTGLRWIAVLEREGFLFRMPDAEDNRRSWVELSEAGTEVMTAYLRDMSDRMNNIREYNGKTKRKRIDKFDEVDRESRDGD